MTDNQWAAEKIMRPVQKAGRSGCQSMTIYSQFVSLLWRKSLTEVVYGRRGLFGLMI